MMCEGKQAKSTFSLACKACRAKKAKDGKNHFFPPSQK